MANGPGPPALPLEIVMLIISHISNRKDSQGTLYSTALVSRVWYTATLPRLYAHPHLDGNSFQPFVRTICPSVNAHIRKTDLSALVRVLDMSGLVHDSSRSMTARLLSRLKFNMETFVAPQTTFSLLSYSALAKCSALKKLDLSYVSEYVPLDRLFSSISKVDALHSLHISRSTVSDAVAARLRLSNDHVVHGPPNLKSLHISGTTSPAAASLLCAVDLNLDYLHIMDCHLDVAIETKLLYQFCPTASSIELGPRLNLRDNISWFPFFEHRPKLKHLTLNQPHFIISFQHYLDALVTGKTSRSLNTLTLDWREGLENVDIAAFGGLDPEIISYAVATDALVDLRKVIIKYPQKYIEGNKKFNKSLQELTELLEALQEERAAERGVAPKLKDTGVWLVQT